MFSGNTKKECLELLALALSYAQRGKGILWLAEKFFLAAIAVSSQYLVDGGRQKGCCKYHYASFLLDKFPGADPEEPFVILTEVRDSAIGKDWPLYEAENEEDVVPPETVFSATAIQLHRVLLDKARSARNKDPAKSERLSRLAERRAKDGADPEEPFVILTEVRDSAIGKDWPLYEAENEEDVVPPETVFSATAIQLHRVLLDKARSARNKDPAKSERLSRLAERRAKDANDIPKTAEAILEIGISQLIMNNLNNAHKTFLKAYKIYEADDNIVGLCDSRMHLAAVMQRLGDYETSAKLLTEMGALAMEHGLRRQLGRALHLLGELHLRREKPELGTQHLTEAFQCFMGFNWQYATPETIVKKTVKSISSNLDVIFKTNEIEIYEEEAEQSRLMHAISAGQEIMASFFNLLRVSGTCSVAKVKTIEWKLSRCQWWLKKAHHDLVPCICPLHNRTPLDVLRVVVAAEMNFMALGIIGLHGGGSVSKAFHHSCLGQRFHRIHPTSRMQIEAHDVEKHASEEEVALLGRTGTVQDMTKLRSSFYKD
ncbi:jg9043 [Pararge aegeria aegeria]|uniref:Tetratricopeptide repeat protein 29 n=1 Tax=Pararge aegeria aegeria TaxID=348720 RepID=A0A8S4REH6_9NEOP|nr:jg9043 [Pararge aegeria aegeria]